MIKFKKFAPNVFVAESDNELKKDEIIAVETKYGKEIRCKVFNQVGNKNGLYYYSIIREDDESFADKKVKKYENATARAEEKSKGYQDKAREGGDFLSLGEPIKIGHHSEKRHRALLERNNNRMRNCITESEKAEEFKSKAVYWKNKANEINLSMFESLEYFTFKLEQAQKYHKDLKDGIADKKHSYSMSYAKKEVNNLLKKVELADKLRGER